MAGFVRSVANREPWKHPLLAVPGWWRRDVRILYPSSREAHHAPIPDDVPPLLITGATGTLGQAFARRCRLRGIPFRLTSRAETDIADPASVSATLARHKPWAVVNTAGFVRVADAERDAERCWRENVTGPANLAAGCRGAGIPIVTFSSDLVFAGDRSSPYRESDKPAPLSVYGLSKAVAEGQVLAANPNALVVRTAAFFSPWDRHNFVTLALKALAAGERFSAQEQTISPTYVPDLVDAVLDLLLDGEMGIWHVVNDGVTTWMDLARSAAKLAGLDAGALEPAQPPEFLPRYSAMTSERGTILRPWDKALADYWREVGPEPVSPDACLVER
jgi:dTDP-4-dehydrorhamnose reductase